ncbi:FadR/GntR family transcriptional regulator [Desertihabitans aurantiacus]|uniref:FadR/GntR family transcriptional regulator n=1 Tax=Desertihabitans aurantiacus TaxID=2282477 RepID=UPI000DF75E9A|nr:FCD domain-containing protein [Desertihabitans aurantiacus]
MSTTQSTSRSSAASNQRRIQDRIKQYVLDHGLAAGDPMPTEPVLMEVLGVSRNALREAMKALQALGFIDIRHGFGTYVGQPGLDPLRESLTFRMTRSLEGDLAEVRNLLDVRQALEVGFAEEVVGYYRDHPTDELDRLVSVMEAVGAVGGDFLRADLDFHLALYAPLDNPLSTDLLTVFWRAFHEVDPRLPQPDYSQSESAHWHRMLLDALVAGDPMLYMQRMREHFSGIRARLPAHPRADGASAG